MGEARGTFEVQPAEARLIDVRPAEAGDLKLVARFIRELAAYEKLEHEAVFRDEDLHSTLFGPEKCAEAVLAFQDNSPAGFAIFFFAYSTFLARPVLYLEDLFVSPEFRGQGLGKALFAHLLKVARDKRCGRFEWSVLDWNSDAISFYESLGASPQKEWVRYRLTADQIARLAE